MVSKLLILCPFACLCPSQNFNQAFEKWKKISLLLFQYTCTVWDPLEHIMIFASWYVEKVHGTDSALT